MTLSIRTKLFLTLLLATALVVAGMLVFMRWSFHVGLVELANERQQKRIDDIGERLAERYLQDGSWKRLRDDKRLWIATLHGRDERRFRKDRQRPPRWARRALGEPGVWPPEPSLHRPPPDARPRPIELRVMLLDADGSIVYGRPELLAGTQRFPLELTGRRIGELALLPGPPVSELGEIRFRERHTSMLLLVALTMIALSAALSFPLAKRLVRPVRGFQSATRQLAAGNYHARVSSVGDNEIGQLGRDINALAETLERNEHARRRWVADISHELRTPLALLRAELEAIQDGVRPLNRAAVDSLHGDALRLSRLVDDLYELSMSDLGALDYRKTETDLQEVLTTDINAFRSKFSAAGLDLKIANRLTAAPILRADGHRLSQLFRNLLRNSLQNTDAGGELEVTLDREEGDLIVDFMDTTPDVPAEALPRLFERLYRVDESRSRDYGGAGLGLAICRNIVEAHGGSIEARPSTKGGICIRIKLPLESASVRA
jgi:two-component system sensor histidine kinase BaeS